MTSKQVQLTLRGRNASEVEAMLADPPRKLDVPAEVVTWLTTKGPHGTRGIELQTRTNTLIQKSRDKKSLLLVGSSEATLAAKSILEGLHVKRRQIQQAVRYWLTIPGKGAGDARSLALDRKFDTCISMSKLSDNDPASVVDLAVVGEREESVNAVLALIDELHVKNVQIPQAVRYWLTIPGKGAGDARSLALDRKFDTCISMSEPSDDDPASVVDLAVVGEREESVNDVLAIIDGLHVKNVQIPQAVYGWLSNACKGASCARATDLERKCGICIHVGPPSDDDPASVVDMAVVGERKENVNDVLAIIDGLHVKNMQIPQAVYHWLINTSKGANCAREMDLERKFDTCVHLGKPGDDSPTSGVDLTIVGEREESVNHVLAIIDGLHVKHMHIPQAVYHWLINTSRGASCAREMDLERKFDTCISMGEPSDDGEPACVVDVAVVGDCEQNVDEVLAIIDGLHAKHSQIPQAVHAWLVHASEGSETTRSLELSRQFDAHIAMAPLSDDKDPARVMAYAVVGESEENVDQVLAAIENIAVEKVKVTKLQAEFWMGHEDEQQRNRPHHKLEDTTNTYVGYDERAPCFHVTGSPDCVRAAVEEISQKEHIALRTNVVSFAMSNFIVRARGPHENDDRQIHLTAEGMRPGTWELRRLYVVSSQGDEAEADRADEELMRKLDLDEVVLEVPMWAQFLVKECRGMEERTVRIMEKSSGTGIGFSTDAIKGRVIVNIAGSRSTVKRGMEEVIRRIEGHAKYKVGDICLRRIQGQSVDTAGFKKIEDASPLDLSRSKEPFSWERLTQERWCYVGAPLGGRPRNRPRQPSV